uniref:Uncharacterized protein n=1 Tax=Hyaloperonospora arabidopsidis (strain Emoy2) TaxID=559515 RepID=M4C1V7_HYAAE
MLKVCGSLPADRLTSINIWMYDVLQSYWQLGIVHILQAIFARKCRCRDATLPNSAH